MLKMSRTLTPLLISITVVSIARGQAETPQKTVQEWIKNLASEKFAIREEASRRLLHAGNLAVPHLATAIGSDDHEVVERMREDSRDVLLLR